MAAKKVENLEGGPWRKMFFEIWNERSKNV